MEANTFLKKTGFKYCPKCGSENLIDKPGSFECARCGFVYFHGTAAATSCILLNDKNQMLLIRRKRDPGKGLYDLPGGFVDYFETLEQGAMRELKEEIGFAPHLTYYASRPNTYQYKNVIYHTADCFFTGKIDDPSLLTAGDDAESITWVPLKKLDLKAFAFESVRSVLREFLKTN